MSQESAQSIEQISDGRVSGGRGIVGLALLSVNSAELYHPAVDRKERENVEEVAENRCRNKLFVRKSALRGRGEV